MKLKTFILSLCFKIIDKICDESQIVEPSPQFEKLIDDLTERVVVGKLCMCPQGSTCEFFKLDEDGDELCFYGDI